MSDQSFEKLSSEILPNDNNNTLLINRELVSERSLCNIRNSVESLNNSGSKVTNDSLKSYSVS